MLASTFVAEKYADVEAALRAAVALPDVAELGLGSLAALRKHPDLQDVQRIGGGGMGAVYRARHEGLAQRVAIKVLRPDSGDGDGMRRLRREAQTLARIRHPQVVRFLFVDEIEGCVLLGMELLEGVTLDRWCEQESPPVDARRDLLLAAGEGLAATHRAGFVHRDFKPSNVMVRAAAEGDTNRGRACLIDFGLARTIQRAGQGTLGTITRTGGVVGTEGYMAPEQAQGERGDARSDQYSFARTALELLGDGIADELAPALEAEPSSRFADMETLLNRLRSVRLP